MINLKSLVLPILLLPWCCCINDPPSQEAYLDKPIFLNDQRVTIRDLYGDIHPTTTADLGSEIPIIGSSVSTKSLNEACDNVNYVRRQYNFEPTQAFSLSPISTPHSDTPTAIAEKITTDLNNPLHKVSPIFAVIGDTFMGKTVALAKIHQEILQKIPTAWVININLLDLIDFDTPASNINIKSMLQAKMDPTSQKLFDSVLTVNPKKIVLLLDGLDELGPRQVEAVVDNVAQLVQKGTSIVLTGREHTLNHLQAPKLDLALYKIPEMNFPEMMQFLMNIWSLEMERESNPSISLDPARKKIKTYPWSTRESRLKEYTVAFSQTYYKTSLPRTPVILTIFAKTFVHLSTQLYTVLSDVLYRVGALDYATKQSNLPSDLNTVLEQVQVNKYKVFQKMFNKMSDAEDAASASVIRTKIYGPLALLQVLHEASSSESVGGGVIEQFLLKKMEYFNEWSLITLKYVNSRPENPYKFEFIHAECKYYFAAEYISYLKQYSIYPPALMSTIFLNPAFRPVMKFLNYIPGPILGNILKKLIVKNHNLNYQLLDNILEQGNQNMFCEIGEMIEKMVERYKLQFIKYIKSEKTTSKWVKSIFGICPREITTPRTIHSRMELLVEQNLVGGLHAMSDRLPNFKNPENYQRILRTVVAKEIPNLSDFKFFEALFHQYKINYDDLLYHTIDNVGDGCQSMAEYLLSQGAIPSMTDIQTGRTLLHAAVKWRSKNLLEFVLEKLRVPPVDLVDKAGSTVLSIALDANPSTIHCPSSWWEMMSYLVEHVDNLLLPSKEMLTVSHEVDSKWEILLAGRTENPAATKSFMTYEESLVHTDSRSPAKWGLSPEALSSRRNTILNRLYGQKSDISVLEVLVHYRNMGPVRLDVQEHYRNSMETFLKRDQNLVQPEKRSQTLNILIDNIVSLDDFKDLNYFLDLKLIKNLPSNAYELIISKLETRFMQANLDIPSTSSQQLPYDNFYQEALNLQGRMKDLMNTAINLEEPSTSGDNIDLTKCLSHRTRRTVPPNVACLFSWRDVDNFNDAIERRTVDQVVINSNKFLQTVALEELTNAKKSQQLMSFVKQITEKNKMEALTGNMRLLTKELLLNHKSLTAYRQSKQLHSVIDELLDHQSLKKMPPVSSRALVMYAATAIPLIQTIFGTISACSNGTNTDCIIGSGTLAFTAFIIPAQAVAPKLLPWTINWLSKTALGALPRFAPNSIRHAILGLRQFGLTSGVALFLRGTALAFLGLQLYGIITMTMMLDACARQGCLPHVQFQYLLSWAFSATSIALTIHALILPLPYMNGIMIVLSLIEIIMIGVIEISYYKRNYHTTWQENFRIFFHKTFFQPPPADVQSLVKQTHWRKSLYQYTMDNFEFGDENMVGYGIGLGAFSGDRVIPATSYINMEKYSPMHRTNLSRVIPVENANMPLVCLPRYNPTIDYEKYSTSSPNAFYKCDNAFVVTNKKRWGERLNKKLYILYNLEYVEAGMIIGHDHFNNFFLVKTGTKQLKLIGSRSMINTFIIESDSFNGNIMISSQAEVNVIDVSPVKSSLIINFAWYPKFAAGNIRFSKNSSGILVAEKFFLINTRDTGLPKLHVVGRKHIQDFMTCDYSKTDENDSNFESSSITVDGRGGKSSTEMDTISDCKLSIVHPFTYISGTNSTNMMYIANVPLSLVTGQINTMTAGASTIDLQQSSFTVVFVNRPLFESISSVTYAPSNQTLTWHLKYSIFTSLFLSITPYGMSSPDASENITREKLKYKSPNCIFIDSFFNSTVVPVMPSPTDGIATTSVDRFNVFASVDSPRLKDALAHYRRMKMYISEELHVVTHFTHSPTGQSFTFGSTVDDQFYIDGNTTFLSGGNGCDVYALNSKSPKYVWIDNEASDYALDTLVIPDTLCDSLHAETGAPLADYCDNSEDYDVTLFCSVKIGMKMSPAVHVVLRNYLLESRHRHLQIYWQNSMYIVLPPWWIQDDADSTPPDNNTKLELALLFSDDWKYTTLTMQSRDRYLVINMTSKGRNPLVAYRSGPSNVILAQRLFNRDSSSYISLEKFFINNTMTISPDWLNLTIFILHSIVEYDVKPTILTVQDIYRLLSYNDSSIDLTPRKNYAELIEEYFVNITDRVQRVIIDHNRNIATNEQFKLGILTITGVQPRAFRLHWSNGSLSLRARQTHIQIKNWCHSINRLYRIEFMVSLNQSPIIISSLPGMNCENTSSPRQVNRMLKKIHLKFFIAQKELLSSDLYDTDDARLRLCFATLFVVDVVHDSMFRLFGFSSMAAQAKFIQNNCKALFTRQDLFSVSLSNLNATLEYWINLYKARNIINPEYTEYIVTLRKVMKNMDKKCWTAFSQYLHYPHNISTYHSDCAHVFN